MRIITAIFSAAAWTAVLIAAMTIGGELYRPFKEGLKNLFTHHWIGKGVVSLAFFLAVSLFLFFVRRRTGEADIAVRRLFWASLGSSAAIVVFYLYEWFSKH